MKLAKLETAIRTVIDFNKAFNHHDVPSMLALVSEDCVFGDPDPYAGAASYSGRKELSGFLTAFFSRHPQAHLEIEEIFGFSIHCVMRWRFDYLDASGPGCRFRGVDLYQVKNALIVDKISYFKKQEKDSG
jgi:limonene-1,2-epoxide hydrolase